MADVKTIFIVDDDPAQAMMLQDYLGKYSWIKSTIFNSGEECLKNLHLNPQIVFLDYNFDLAGSDLDGLDILKEIKAKKPETEVVMISGQDKIDVAVNTMKYGAFDYVVKSESAFHRAEHLIFNIIRRFKLQKEAKLYKTLTYFLAVGIIIMLIITIVLYKTGHISNNPGWF